MWAHMTAGTVQNMLKVCARPDKAVQICCFSGRIQTADSIKVTHQTARNWCEFVSTWVQPGLVCLCKISQFEKLWNEVWRPMGNDKLKGVVSDREVCLIPRKCQARNLSEIIRCLGRWNKSTVSTIWSCGTCNSHINHCTLAFVQLQ